MVSASAWAAGGYVYEAAGEVSIAVGKTPSHPAVKYNALTSNTLVSTGDNGHAVLKFEDGQVVAMQANTAFNVREYRFEPNKIEKSNIIFTKLKGGLLFITGLIGQRSKKSFRLATPNATIGVRGTEFMVVMADDALYGKVLAGSISMTNSAGTATFNAGQTVLASSPSAMPVAVPAEALPPGIFGQLEAIRLPPAEPGTSPVPAAEEIGALPADTAVTGSALLGAAAAVAGGLSTAMPPPGITVAMLAGAAADVPSYGMMPAASVSPRFPPSIAAAPSGAGATATAPVPTASGAAPAASVGDPSLFGRHNFTPGRAGTGEICVFCHTPQGSEDEVAVPLWNRTLSPIGEYKAYSSIGSATAAATGSVSIACLSCHDGTQAPNVVINSPVNYSDMGIYPAGLEPVQISSRKYLKDHHPVSMLYGGGGMSEKQPDAPVDALTAFNNADYDAIAVRKLTGVTNATSRDFQFGDPVPGDRVPGLFNKQDFNQAEHSGSGSGTVWWLESKGTGKGRQKADFYLYTRTDTVDGLTINRPYVECSSCHDPHSTNSTFLRIKNEGSSVCMTCHNK